MLKKLRSLSLEAKKKIVVLSAGSLTFLVFIFWITNSFGTFSKTLGDTRDKGAAVFGAIEENVGKVYNAFEKIIPKDQNNNGSTTEQMATTTSTTTPETSTTTENLP